MRSAMELALAASDAAIRTACSTAHGTYDFLFHLKLRRRYCVVLLRVGLLHATCQYSWEVGFSF